MGNFPIDLEDGPPPMVPDDSDDERLDDHEAYVERVLTAELERVRERQHHLPPVCDKKCLGFLPLILLCWFKVFTDLAAHYTTAHGVLWTPQLPIPGN